MSSLVVYFSKTGNTKFVAEEVFKASGADIEEIVEEEKRKDGFISYMMAGRDGMMKKKTKIQKTQKNPDNYETIYIGSPVWGFNLAPAIRSYLDKNKIKDKKLALFCTMGGTGDKQLFSSIKELIPENQILGELSIKESDLKDKEKIKEKIAQWVESIQ
ncbi:MAG: flavodoxin [Candidatus Altiarchaeota archaeon]